MPVKLISGSIHQDDRGKIVYNNDFDASLIKRIYFIENNSTNFVRGWQGHQIEQRWFSAVRGEFKIQLIRIDQWEEPNVNLEVLEFNLDANTFDVLHVPSGYVTSIQSLEDNSRLMAQSDYRLGEIKDEHRFPIDYFNQNKK